MIAGDTNGGVIVRRFLVKMSKSGLNHTKKVGLKRNFSPLPTSGAYAPAPPRERPKGNETLLKSRTMGIKQDRSSSGGAGDKDNAAGWLSVVF